MAEREFQEDLERLMPGAVREQIERGEVVELITLEITEADRAEVDRIMADIERRLSVEEALTQQLLERYGLAA